jgi:hypothetical protein
MTIHLPDASAHDMPPNGKPPDRRGERLAAAQWALQAAAAAGNAKINHAGRRGMAKITRVLTRAGMPMWQKGPLGAAFLAVVAILDFPLFEGLLGFAPQWLWAVAVGTNGLLIALSHSGLTVTWYDLVHTWKFQRGAKWRVEACLVSVMLAGLCAYSGAASWARAKAMADETALVLGVRGPGLLASLFLFVGLHLVFFGGGALFGWQQVKADHGVFEVSARARRKVYGLAQDWLLRLEELAQTINHGIASDAAEMGPYAPTTLPTCKVPDDLREAFERILDDYEPNVPDADDEWS